MESFEKGDRVYAAPRYTGKESLFFSSYVHYRIIVLVTVSAAVCVSWVDVSISKFVQSTIQARNWNVGLLVLCLT